MANRKQSTAKAVKDSVQAEKEKATASVTGTDKKPAAKKPVVKKPAATKAEREAKAPMAKRAARVTKKSSEGKPQVRTPGRIAKSIRVVTAKKEGDAVRKKDASLAPRRGRPTPGTGSMFKGVPKKPRKVTKKFSDMTDAEQSQMVQNMVKKNSQYKPKG